MKEGRVFLSKKPISMCVTELGHFSINENAGIHLYKHYCHIMPNAIEDLFVLNYPNSS